MLTDLIADTLLDGTTAYLVFQNAKAVGRVDMALDQFSKRDLPVRVAHASIVGTERVFADHEQERDIGLASVADMAPGSAEEVWTLEGFLVDGLLDL
ncbi:MAG: hypothetical protein PHR35_20300, partial [Kiritimatiellae bacterium]|nr:hypothetical protein [Kiritimatiellia bacterium]